MLAPLLTVEPLKEQDEDVGGAAAEHEVLVYEPESVPLLHMRAWKTHEEPNGTELDWYLVTFAP